MSAMRERGRLLFDRARRLADESALPLEVIDVEVLLDGEHGVLHLIRCGECDVRPFVSSLSREFEMHILLTDLGGPAAPEEEEEEHAGCGREGCGGGAGGCSSCGAGGGCNSCGTETHDVQETFAALREKMERRTTLL